MPDVLNRPQKEARVAAALQSLRENQRAKLVRLLGNPPDVSRVPESFWKEVEQEEQQALLLLMLLMMDDAAANLLSGTDANQQHRFQVGQGIRQRAESHARQFGRGAAENTQALLRNEIDRLREVTPDTSRFTTGDIDWNRIYPPSRAETSGVTETTGANSMAELEVVDVAKRSQQGGDGTIDGGPIVVPQVIWYTEDDNSVCPICRPLHLTAEDVWGIRFPNGPAAHPRCRCWLKIGKLVFGRSGLPGPTP